MSDTIEVLKDLKRQYSDYCNEYQLEDDNKFIDALDEALLALEQKENVKKIINKIDEIVSKDIWDFGQHIEDIEDEVDRQSNGKKPQMTTEEIDEIDKLKGRVLEARKIKNYLENVRIKKLEEGVSK